MENIKSLNRAQKAILAAMAAMILIFAVIYPRTIAKVGYEYNGAILAPTQEDGRTLYSGKMQGKPACITVSDQTVLFQAGDKTYGPYTCKNDPTAIPEEMEINGNVTGIEIYEGSELFFRGSVVDLGDYYWLDSEDGTYNSMVGTLFVTSDGIERDANGEPVDRMKPSPVTVYELLNNPKLTHKGDAFGWVYATLICILNAVAIIFADSLFRWNLAFRIRHAESAEPSDWEITCRYVSWMILTIAALVFFIMGLQ